MPNLGMYLRIIIAFTVVGVTGWLTVRDSGISSEWEAVFLVVVGYYFKDRPFEDAYLSEQDSKIENFNFFASWLEISLQFILALLLVIGTFFAFVYPTFRQSVSGVWVGAVVLAVGFYFKDTRIPILRRRHHIYGGVIAAMLTGLTIPLLIYANRYANATATPLSIPVQWVGLV